MEKEARGIKADFVFGDVARRGKHARIHVIAVAIAGVKVDGLLGAVFQQSEFVQIAILFIDFGGFLIRDDGTDQGVVRLDDFFHFVLNPKQHRGGRTHMGFEDIDQNGTRDVIGQADLHFGVAAMERHRRDIAEGRLIDFGSFDIGKIEKLDLCIIIDFVIELAGATIDARRDDFPLWIGISDEVFDGNFLFECLRLAVDMNSK